MTSIIQGLSLIVFATIMTILFYIFSPETLICILGIGLLLLLASTSRCPKCHCYIDDHEWNSCKCRRKK